MRWIMRIQQRLSDRAHAGGDAFAEQAGWTITKTRGRFGYEGRVYRDPRFEQRHPKATTVAQPGGEPRASTQIAACIRDDVDSTRPSSQAGSRTGSRLANG